MSPGKLRFNGERPPLQLDPFIMGGAGFSYQLVSEPDKAPVVDILEKAFQSGVQTIDTSPYYDPSELILGAALSHPRISQKYRREDYTLMTKVGRITSNHFDYSPQWIRTSVERSLERFNTTYLDVVFCHDVEFVSIEEAVTAVGTLFELVQQGSVKYVGISGYDLSVLSRVAGLVLETYGQPVDVVQTWAQLTLQNTRLETYGLPLLKDAGVKVICASSPLAVGLLSSRGVPVGGLGDWHPAPEGLRLKVKQASELIESQGESTAALALRYAIRKASALSNPDVRISTISGVASLEEITMNVQTARQVLGDSLKHPGMKDTTVDTQLEKQDNDRAQLLREHLGSWLDHDFSS
ncbi:NADP-dependent oxidoreductase domain-containing protein [Boeremia exigua]|uniref:NADP-dependent oxidoreductase domain-containing protein n=1 Tax=Boeremia exigua TaxID=749465 RepID=UPI001E8D54DB|nr:NADP-dependent oxidoreductase domain-containing protein [Boeremia exigua]KAH6613856.1 NADP-dependent oxidoreductase domain-containing protein [Boeremia exigua]